MPSAVNDRLPYVLAPVVVKLPALPIVNNVPLTNVLNAKSLAPLLNETVVELPVPLREPTLLALFNNTVPGVPVVIAKVSNPAVERIAVPDWVTSPPSVDNVMLEPVTPPLPPKAMSLPAPPATVIDL